jgi:hypothetical protein
MGVIAGNVVRVVDDAGEIFGFRGFDSITRNKSIREAMPGMMPSHSFANASLSSSLYAGIAQAAKA